MGGLGLSQCQSAELGISGDEEAFKETHAEHDRDRRVHYSEHLNHKREPL